MSLRGNGITGTLSFHKAQRQCEWLVAMGRTMRPEEWVTGLIEEAGQEANAQFLSSFVG